MAQRGPTSQAAIDALAELRRAPRHVLLRAIDRLEQGIASLEGTFEVPSGWFLTTASGYDSPKRGRVSGAIALADAAEMIAALCKAIDHHGDELPDGSLGVEELAERWNVSPRTLQRYRAKGLAARSVRAGRTRRLVFSPTVIESFEQRAGAALSEATRFSRFSDAERARATALVAEMKSKGIPITEATHRAGRELGRSAEAIRQLIAKEQGPGTTWSDRERRFALRAQDRFIEPAAIAERLARDTGLTRRIIDVQRLERLRGQDISVPAIEPPTVPRLPLGAQGPTLLADLIAEMRDTSAPDRTQERALTIYARFLVGRAATSVAKLEAAKLRAEPIDSAETDLLWAARLRVEALRPLLGFVLRGVEARLGGEIETLPARLAATRLQLALAAAAEAAHRYDPGRGGRLSAAVTIAVDRAAGEASADHARSTGARRSFANARIEDWTRRVSPWQRFLEPPPSLRMGLHSLDESQRSLLEARFGFGERPHTLAELSERFDIHRPWIARRVREAAHAAIHAGRDAQRADPHDTISP